MILWLALGVWLLNSVLIVFVDAPSWVWRVWSAAIGTAVVVLVMGASIWYLGPAVGAIAMLIQRVDDLLRAAADRLISRLTR